MTAVFAKYPGFCCAFLLLALIALPAGCGPALPVDGIALDSITMPPGFHIAVFTDEVPGARSLALGPEGTLFVGTRDPGKVYAVPDRNGDGKADEVLTLLEGRTAWGRPVDVLVSPDGSLLVSDDPAGAVYRITYQ